MHVDDDGSDGQTSPADGVVEVTFIQHELSWPSYFPESKLVKFQADQNNIEKQSPPIEGRQ